MEGGPTKINPPNSHPSNPIYKAAMAAQEPKPASKEKKMTADEETVSEKTVSEKTPQHEINKTALIIGRVAVVALLFMASRKHRVNVAF